MLHTDLNIAGDHLIKAGLGRTASMHQKDVPWLETGSDAEELGGVISRPRDRPPPN